MYLHFDDHPAPPTDSTIDENQNIHLTAISIRFKLDASEIYRVKERKEYYYFFLPLTREREKRIKREREKQTDLEIGVVESASIMRQGTCPWRELGSLVDEWGSG